MNRTPLITPGSVLGFASARVPSALPKGVVANLYDFRLDEGVLRVRWGSVKLLDNVSGAYEFRGCFECVMNGVPTLFWGGRTGGKTLVAKSVDHGATWTTVTPSSGTYGDTRFPSEGWLTWALATNDGTDVLVIQNGVDAPRLYDGANVSTVSQTSSAPSRMRTGVTLGAGADFTTSPAPTDSNSAHLDGSIIVQAGTSVVALNVQPGVVNTDTTVVTFPSFVVGTDDRLQFVWFVDSGDERWRAVKIEAATTSAGPWTTVYDPETSPLVAVVSDDTGATAELAAVDASPISGQTIGAFRFSYQAAAPASAFYVFFIAMGQSGLIPGGTAYGAAFGSSTSPIVSAGAVSSIVGRDNPGGIRLPLSSLINYVYTLQVRGAAPPQFNRLRVYRNEVGSTGYYLIDSVVLAGPPYTYVDDGTKTVDYSHPLPSAQNIPLPIGGPMASINGRLFVGSGNRLYYSAAGEPFSFTVLVQFDSTNNPIPDSAGSFSKPGETFTGIVGVGRVDTGAEGLGTPRSGAIAVYPVTDRWTYVLSGFDAVSLNKTTRICIGSKSPYSFDTTSGGFYFLDSERQIRSVFGAESKAISKFLVDDKLKAIPNASLGMAWGAYLDGRYRLAYTGAGLTMNFDILIWNESFGWESNDRRPSYPAIAILPYYDASQSRTRLLSFGETQLAEIDKPGLTTDFGQPGITATVEMGEIRFWPFAASVKGAVFLTDSDPTGKAVYSFLATTGARLGTTLFDDVSLAPRKTGESRVYARTKTGLGTDSLTVQPILTLDCKGGKRLYQFEIEASQGTDAVTP